MFSLFSFFTRYSILKTGRGVGSVLRDIFTDNNTEELMAGNVLNTARPRPPYFASHSPSNLSELVGKIVGKTVVFFVVIYVVVFVLVGGGFHNLALLVLDHQLFDVGLSLGELQLVHALADVPVQECLAPEHGPEPIDYALEHLPYGAGVANERGGHVHIRRRLITQSDLNVVRYPTDERAAFLPGLHNGRDLNRAQNGCS